MRTVLKALLLMLVIATGMDIVDGHESVLAAYGRVIHI